MVSLFDLQKKPQDVKKIKVVKDGIYILDKDIQKQINKTKLSPSMIGQWLAAPADYILNKYILSYVKDEEETHLTRGTWFHSTMEEFYKLPQEKRTKENLLKVAKKVTSYDDFKLFSQDDDNKEWYKKALQSYINKWLVNAKNEKVARLFINGEAKEGLELSIFNGKIGNAKRPCLGFIDKIIEGENGLIVQDWKTGKTITDFNPNKKISADNPFDYWRQQVFYTILLEQNNAIVESASLIFPMSEPATEVIVDLNNPFVKEQVIKDVEQVDRELDVAISENYFFPFKAGKYNNWSSWLGHKGSAKKPDIHEDKFLMLAEIEV